MTDEKPGANRVGYGGAAVILAGGGLVGMIVLTALGYGGTWLPILYAIPVAIGIALGLHSKAMQPAEQEPAEAQQPGEEPQHP